MKNRSIFKKLTALFNGTLPLKISDKDKYVIFSDLHMGNGGRRDDFLKNSELFRTVLTDYYYKKKYDLILNGDVEELYRFRLKNIHSQWKDIYEIFDTFKKKRTFFKNIGNHDYKLNFLKPSLQDQGLTRAVKLEYRKNTIFIFHGHQVSGLISRPSILYEFILRYIANPLRIKNFEVPYSSSKKFKTEKNAYEFSCNKKIISIIGHTHRPLFQSLSKIDLLRFKIEQLCRDYQKAGTGQKKKIEKAVNTYKEELHYYFTEKHQKERLQNSLYSANLIVPSLFNSGCVIGKRGITAIEIHEGSIRLVHWFDREKKDKYLKYSEPKPERLGKSPYFRMIFNQDSLSYIFSRIKLLT